MQSALRAAQGELAQARVDKSRAIAERDRAMFAAEGARRDASSLAERLRAEVRFATLYFIPHFKGFRSLCR